MSNLNSRGVDYAPNQPSSAAHFFNGRLWFFLIGIALVGGSLIAALNIPIATLVSVLYIGTIMIIAGALQIIHAVALRGWKLRMLHLLGGAVYAAAGVVAWHDPFISAVSISLLLGILLEAAGIMRICMSFQLRGQRGLEMDCEQRHNHRARWRPRHSVLARDRPFPPWIHSHNRSPSAGCRLPWLWIERSRAR